MPGGELPKLMRVRPGDPVSAAEYNKLLDAVERIAKRLFGAPLEQTPGTLFVGELEEDMDAADIGKEIRRMYYSQDDDAWRVHGQTTLRAAETAGALWLAGSRAMYLGNRTGNILSPPPLPMVYCGKLGAQLSAGGSATMNVWDVNSSGDFTDSGLTLTVYDWLLSAGQTIASGKKVISAQIIYASSPLHIVIAAECA